MSAVNWLRIAATTFGSIALLGAGYRVAKGYTLNGYDTNYYSHAKDKGLPYIVTIELANDVGYVVAWAILFVVIALVDNSKVFFVSGFVMAAVLVWGALWFTPYRKSAVALH